MIEYHKIHSPYKRDPETKHKTFLVGDWSRPEFGVLANAPWRADEKVDGTNIRITWSNELATPKFGGRTDRAQIPAKLIEYLHNTFTPASMTKAFPDLQDATVVLYGEGYGAGIQKGGGNYVARFQNTQYTQQFALFDVMIIPQSGRPIWLRRESVEEIAASLFIAYAPVYIPSISLMDAIAMIEHEGASMRSYMPGAQEGTVIEGFILRPTVELFDRMGRRIITKIKVKDFPRE